MLSTITNLFIGAYGKKGSKLTEPKDYLINWSGEQEEQKVQTVVDDMKKFLQSFAQRHNKEVEKKTRKTVKK